MEGNGTHGRPRWHLARFSPTGTAVSRLLQALHLLSNLHDFRTPILLSNRVTSCCILLRDWKRDMDDQRNSFAPFEHAKSHRKLVSIRLHFKSALERNNGKLWSVNDPFQRAMFSPKLHWYGLVPIASWCLVIGTEMKLGLSKLQVSRQSKTRQTKHKTKENTDVVTRPVTRRVAQAFWVPSPRSWLHQGVASLLATAGALWTYGEMQNLKKTTFFEIYASTMTIRSIIFIYIYTIHTHILSRWMDG